MKIERLKIKNFRALQDVEMTDVPSLAVFIGENGSGKSTLFRVFRFLKNALHFDVNWALQRLGGYHEVVTRDHSGKPILIEVEFSTKIARKNRLFVYSLEIGFDKSAGEAFVKKETMSHENEKLFEFKNGKGFADFGLNEEMSNLPGLISEEPISMGQRDMLAINVVGSLRRSKVARDFRRFVAAWHMYDFHITASRQRGRSVLARNLMPDGGNLATVTRHLYENERATFDTIVKKFKERVPGMESVEIKFTEDGYVLLQFKDGSFKDPFDARYVSDGTIKMFAYLVLLHAPRTPSFLCIEEPENQLYPNYFDLLVDELQQYAKNGGQVFVSTHSPDILNHVEIEEAFYMDKADGVTKIEPFADDHLIKDLIDSGDKLGWLWRQGVLPKFMETPKK